MKQIKTKSGEKIGRVFDVRITQKAGKTEIFLVYGGYGFLERLGFFPRNTKTIPFNSIIRIEKEKIIVSST